MATMASLIVEVGSNIVGFVSGTTKMEHVAKRTSQRLEREFVQLGKKIAAALGAGVLLYEMKGAIDAADKLNDLSKATKVSVEDLSGLGMAAKSAGGDLEGAAQSINKLAQNMGKDAEKFRALGITAKEPVEAFKQLADIFASIEDPQMRAALGAETLGKSWQSAAPLMALGSTEIQKLIDGGKKATGMTAGLAKQADEFNDKMLLLVGSGGLFNAVLGSMLPLLNLLADDLVKNANGVRNLEKEYRPLFEIARAIAIVFGGFSVVLGQVSREIGVYVAGVIAASEATRKLATGDLTGAIQSYKEFLLAKGLAAKGASEARDEFADWTDKMWSLGKAATSTGSAIKGMSEEEYEAARIAKDAAAQAEAAARRFLNFKEAKGSGSAIEQVFIKMQKEARKLRDELAALNGEPVKRNAFAEAVRDLEEKGVVKLNAAIRERLMLEAQVIDSLEEEVERVKKLHQLWASLDAEHQKDIDNLASTGAALKDLADGWKEATEQLELESKLIGLSNVERKKALLLEKARTDIIAAGKNEAAIRDINENLERQLVLLDGINEKEKSLESFSNTLRDQANMWTSLADVAGDFFTDLIMNGKSAFDNLRSSLKRFAAEVIAFFSKRFVLQMVAGLLSGTSMAASAATAASTFGQGTFLGSLANLLGLGSGISTFGSAVSAGFQTGATTSIAQGGFSNFAGSWLGRLAANPITWVVTAALAAAVIIGRRGGGPKEGGSFFGEWSASGDFLGSRSVPGSDNGRFFTPSSQDAEMQQMTNTFATNFFSTLTRLGGTTAGLTFGIGTDQDPRGTAANRVTGLMLQNGVEIFRSAMEAGRDNEDLQRAFGLTLSRMMLGGLQASNLPDSIAAILSSVSAQTGTQEEIEQVIGLATAFGDLLEVVSEFDTSSVLEDAQRTSAERLRLQGDALRKLADNTEMTTDSLNVLTRATLEYRQAAAQLLIELEAVRLSLGELFGGMIEDTNLAGMDPQEQFDYWMSEADRLYDLIMQSTDPGEIDRFSRQLARAWNNAWSLLSPEEQAEQSEIWSTRLDEVWKSIDQHIRRVADTIGETINETLTAVGDTMTEAANTLYVAANTSLSAATTFDASVSRGITVSIILDQHGNAIVTGSSGG